jgi:hypothetical protein
MLVVVEKDDDANNTRESGFRVGLRKEKIEDMNRMVEVYYLFLDGKMIERMINDG